MNYRLIGLKTLAVILFFLFLSPALCAQQLHPCQVVVNMVMADKCFEAMDYMEKYKDVIQQSEETMALYKFKMYGFMNQPDSSLYYLEKILKEYPSIYKGKGSPEEVYFLNLLPGLYHKTYNYAKEYEFFTSIEKELLSPAYFSNVKMRDEQLRLIEQIKKKIQPYLNSPTNVSNCSSEKTVEVPIVKQDSLLGIPIHCNGIGLLSWIDTGAGSHLFMTRKTADKCGMQIENPSDSINVNGKYVSGGFAVADSLQIGQLRFVNIPVCIVNYDDYLFNYPDSMAVDQESLHRYNSTFGISDATIGLPILQMLGSMEIDWNQKMLNLTMKSDVPRTASHANIFISDDKLYGHFLVNDESFVGLLDSGARQICFSVMPSFYHQHPSISLSADRKSMKMLGIGNAFYAAYREIKGLDVVFDDKKIDLNTKDALAWEKEQTFFPKDGWIGFPFLKKLGNKVKFDFVNMRLTAE